MVFIGIEDDGRCAGIEVGDELLTTLASLRAEGSIQPLPSMTVDKVTIKDCDWAVVQVEPSPSPPVRYEGRIWIKTGADRSTRVRGWRRTTRVADAARGMASRNHGTASQ